MLAKGRTRRNVAAGNTMVQRKNRRWMPFLLVRQPWGATNRRSGASQRSGRRIFGTELHRRPGESGRGRSRVALSASGRFLIPFSLPPPEFRSPGDGWPLRPEGPICWSRSLIPPSQLLEGPASPSGTFSELWALPPAHLKPGSLTMSCGPSLLPTDSLDHLPARSPPTDEG